MSKEDFDKDEQDLKDKELEILKEEARSLGINISGNLSAATLAHRIKEAKERDSAADEQILREAKAERAKHRTAAAQRAKMHDTSLSIAERRKAARLLHRVIITCHCPTESKTGGRIFTVGNSAFGTERKYVPYGKPWHVSTMMLNAIREKNFITHTIATDSKNQEVNRHYETPLYSVNVLAPITRDELQVLAKQQRERAGNDPR